MSQPEHQGLRALGERIAREEDAILARPLPAGETALRASAHVRRVPGRTLALGVAAAAAAILVAGGASFVARSPPLAVTVAGEGLPSGGWIAAPPTGEVPIHFSEGTEITLAPEARARVADVTRLGAHVLLESGTAHVSVTPGRGGKWTFTAGPFQVDVKGTKFDLLWSPSDQSFSLKLVEGSVVVSGCTLGDGRALFAGETLSASCLRHELHIDRGGTGGTSEGSSLAAAAPALSASSTAPPPALEIDPIELSTRAPVTARHAAHGDETWQSLARASRFKEAFARLGDKGFDVELGRASRDDLVLLGDVARLSGEASRALAAYQRVRSRFPGSDAAANAAFAMGRVQFDQRQSYTDAASWFATYRRERGEGPLARDATGRQMEALARGGNAAEAARLADEYLARYPHGPHAALARSLRGDAN